MIPAIETRHIYFSYDDRPVLKDINFQIEKQRFTVILGRNGSGKSTLFKVLTGIERCKKGSINVSGSDLSTLTMGQRAKKIGYLPQQHRPIFPFKVRDVVVTGRASYIAIAPKKRDFEIAQVAINRVGIGDLADRPFTELSGGEQQLTMIARVLAQESEIILLDEPTSHLDVFNQARILRLIRDLVDSGLTVVAVLHDPNSAFTFGDGFIFIKGGKEISPSPSQKPWDSKFLRKVYDAELATIPYKNRALVIPS